LERLGAPWVVLTQVRAVTGASWWQTPYDHLAVASHEASGRMVARGAAQQGHPELAVQDACRLHTR
jgi:hypothetical protein